MYCYLLLLLRNSLQTSSLDNMVLGNFILSNSIISVKDLIRWKRGSEIFLIDHYAGDIENKNITGSVLKKFLYQCHTPYNRRVSSHKVLDLKFLSTCIICTIYLHVIQTCLKVTISMFYFCYSKNPSDIMKNIFDSISIYSWKKFPC